MEVHPLAELIPPMTEEEFERLRNDIQRDGFDAQRPVFLFEGKVLDGRHRVKVCAELGVDPVTRDYKGEDPARFVLSSNNRRNLSKSQWAASAVELLPHFKEKAKEAQREAGREHGRGIASTELRGSYEPPTHTDRKSREAHHQAGAEVGISGDTVARAEKVKNVDPVLFGQIKAGKTTVNAALKKLPGKPKRAPSSPPPFDISKPRNQQIANKAKQRLENVIAGLEGYAQGLNNNLRLDHVLAVATDEEAASWVKSLDGSLRELRKFRNQLQERSNG